MDINPLFIRLTCDFLIKKIDELLANNFNVELYYDAEVIDDNKNNIIGRVREMKEKLLAAGLRLTAHAPFIDLHIASLDRLIREASYKRILSCLDFAKEVGINEIIFHHGFDSRIHSYKIDAWFNWAKINWERIYKIAKDYKIDIIIENTYEKEPNIIEKLIFEFSLPFKVCLDVGHLNVTTKNNLFKYLPKWLATFNHHIVAIHLHDNIGEEDAHLSIGKGSIDFIKLFNLLDEYKICARFILENKTEEEIYQSIEYIKNYNVY